MPSLGSIACGTTGLLAFALLLAAVLAPVQASAAEKDAAYAALCADSLTGVIAPCRVAFL